MKMDDKIDRSLETFLASALDQHTILAVTDPKGKITYVNDNLCAVSKYPREELIGRDHRLLNSGSHPKAFMRELWATISSGRVWKGDLKNRAKDGSFYWVDTTIVPFLNQQGKPKHYISIQTDITERKRAEQVLADLKAALDQHAIVAVTDTRGKIIYVNDRFCAVSQYAREELLGQDHRLINSGCHSKAFIRRLWDTIAQGLVWRGELRNRAKDGSYYWVDTTIVPFLDDRCHPYQYIAIRSDVSERKQAEEHILRLNEDLRSQTLTLEEANKELESFSYSISHDLRAPLRHIHGYAEMLAKATEGQLSDRARRFLASINEASLEMSQLIDDLLAFSRASRTEMCEDMVDLNVVLQEALRAQEFDSRNRQIDWNLGPLPPALGDHTMLRQVFRNLIDNAVKYTRGRLPAEISVGYAGEEEGMPVYFVRDNGAGFDMRYVHKLFGVFQRLHRAEEFEGTGIGLAIARRILCRHGGRIWAESQLEHGSTFFFTLKPWQLHVNQGKAAP